METKKFMIRFYILSFALIFSFHCGLSAQQVSPDSLMDSGSIFHRNNEYDKAGEDFKQAMKLYLQRKDTISWIGASFQYGSALVEQGFVREGITVFNKVENKKPLNISLSLEARKANLLGWAYEKLEMPDSVKFYLSNGLKLAEQGQDSLQIARISNNLSYYYQNEGDYERAFKLQKKAIQYFTLINDLPRLSAVLNRSFLTMMDLGLYQQAEEYIRQSLAIREELGNPNLLDVAYHNLAWNFERQGQRDSAIIYYQKSLELSRQLGNPYDITQTLDNIGGLYERSGDFENALAYYNESLDINREIERPASAAESLLRIARVAVQSNDPENASAFYLEALDWLEEANDPRLLSSIYLDLANLETDQKNYQSAKEYITKARKIAEEKGFKTRQIRTFNSLGKLYEKEGDLHASLASYRQAYELSSESTVPEKIPTAILLAKAYNRASSDSAFILAEEVFSLIDSLRTNVAGLAFRSGFFSQHAGFYNEVASWHITRRNDPKKAFELIESAKARVLMDELAEAREKELSSLDESTLIKKQQKAKQIDRLYNQLSATESLTKKSTIRDELKDLEFEYQSFLNQLHVSNVSLKDFKYPQPITLQKAQDMLDSESAILEYAFTEEHVVRLLITEDNITGSILMPEGSPEAKQYFTEKIRTFREAITSKASVNEIQKIGASLYSQLIPSEVSESRSEISNLLIIPGGALTFLPFETLSNNNRYLIEDFHIKYLPSASIYSFINNPHRTTNFELLALAGSGFEGGDGLTSLSSSQASFASLPSTLLEVDSISVNFTNSRILKNDDVTEANLKSHDLSDFRFIHFATHAEVNESTPSQSGLLLSKKTDVESLFGEDGFMNSREISGLKLNADLVTLSACNTGMGKIVTGEGLLGLQRSFLSAGASSVMVSLWSIYDRSTADFMSEFYSMLKTHESADYGIMNRTLDWFGLYEHPLFDYKAKALRDAKLAMISHPYYSHPVHWAPFILIGK
jgi:CHAT domain-containing protein/Tfp pilus assembly protein PilF